VLLLCWQALLPARDDAAAQEEKATAVAMAMMTAVSS
jgi:hypothetical protein